MPAFELEGGLLLALSRGLWDAALLSSAGTLAFWTVAAPRALARAGQDVASAAERVLRRLTRVSLVVAAICLFAWLALEAAQITGRLNLVAVGEVLRGTVFGHIVLMQAAGLITIAATLGRGRSAARRWCATALVAATTALQAGHGHALAMVDGPSLLLAASVVHLLAAAAWLGGLLPLLLLIQTAPVRTGAAAARWFSPLGKWCVGLMVGSAAIQFWQLIGGLPGVIGTAYGWTASAKFVLLGVLFLFACVNRYWLAPRLLGPAAEATRPTLLRSIAVQTGFGLAVVLAASVLSSLPPSIHEQPVWPFPLRPSLVALSDPDLRSDIGRGMLEVTAGALLVLFGIALSKRRALALAGIGAGLAVGSASASHLRLLLVEAYPTSYYRSPAGFAATSISHGAALYPSHCAACHGVDGRGDGPAASGLPVPPADLTAAHLWAHEDGELFWWLTHGMEAPLGGMAMPGFAGQLTPDDRWALTDYVRAHNAGVGLRESGHWTMPIQAPGFSMTCPGQQIVSTADLRGSVLHIVARPPGGGPVPPAPGHSPVAIVTVLLTDRPASPDAANCATADPAAQAAYAAISGIPASQMAGAQFLVDANGWIRAAQRPGDTTVRWADPALLLADVRAISTHPIAAPGGHVHH